MDLTSHSLFVSLSDTPDKQTAGFNTRGLPIWLWKCVRSETSYENRILFRRRSSCSFFLSRLSPGRVLLLPNSLELLLTATKDVGARERQTMVNLEARAQLIRISEAMVSVSSFTMCPRAFLEEQMHYFYILNMFFC